MESSCKKYQTYCDKSQYKEATFFELIKLNLHLFICKLCRVYSTRNGKLTRLITGKEVDCMDLDVNANLKVQLEKELAK